MRQCCRVLGLLATVVSASALAEPMWVRYGSTASQAYAFELGRQCVAITPAHGVPSLNDPAQPTVWLTDRLGQVHVAKVVATDRKRDLALLLIRPPAPDVRVSCGGFPAFNLTRLEEFQPDLTSAPATWFDLIASPAGGLDRFDVALLPGSVRVQSHEFTVTAKPRPDSDEPAARNGGVVSGWNRKHEAPEGRFGRLPVSGNSGAMLWVGWRDSGYFTDQRYDGHQLKYSLEKWGLAHIAGMLLRVGNGRAEVVDARAISDFVGQAVRPVDWSQLRIDAPGAVVSDRRRDRQTGVHFSIGNGVLEELSYEFDLGDDDAMFTAVEVLYDRSAITPSALAPIPDLPIDNSRSTEVLVSVSQYRPAASPAWRESRCSSYNWAPAPEAAAQLLAHRCTLTQPFMARGVRVTLRGVPGRWRLLRLVAER